MHRPGPRVALALALSALLFSACNFLSSQPDDKAITSELQARLYQDPALKTRDIRVVSEKGVVVLTRSEEHTSELQSLAYLVCRLLLEKKKNRVLKHYNT